MQKNEDSMSNLFTKEVYDSIPVFYCKQCLSLRIKDVQGVVGTEFCDECNSTNVGTTDIYTWEELYRNMYGHKFLDKPKY